jgi:hypothetical protein
MAGALVFGLINHFIIDGSDHVANVAAEWRRCSARPRCCCCLSEAAASHVGPGGSSVIGSEVSRELAQGRSS